MRRGTYFTRAAKYASKTRTFTVAQAVFLTGAFDFKAVLLIHRHGRLVINNTVNSIRSTRAQPVVTHVDHCADQRAGNAAIVPPGVRRYQNVRDAAKALGDLNRKDGQRQ